MPDIFTKEKRSEVMSRIRSVGTRPEERLFVMVTEMMGSGFHIERNVRSLPGQPDVLIPGLSLVIFLDGCFYHSCPLHGHLPKSNEEYWAPKLARNRRRDATNRRKLRELGFAVWRLWEHDLKPSSIERTCRTLERRLDKRSATLSGDQWSGTLGADGGPLCASALPGGLRSLGASTPPPP